VQELGRIVRLQVQLAPLKHGERPDRGYDTDRIRRVAALTVTEHGVVGYDEDAPDGIIDVHHRDHPESRYRGDNGISLLTTGHYASMRERFGPHVHDGLAAESVLVDRPGWLDLADLAHGVSVVPAEERSDDDTVPADQRSDDDTVSVGQRSDHLVAAGLLLDDAAPAQPCVEFSRLVSGAPAGSQREPLRELRDGMRGYYLRVARGAGTTLREGDRLVALDER
jgi:hypothetical protein